MASVLGAQMTIMLDHHIGDYGCKDCGVEWTFECVGALARKKIISLGHLSLR